MGRQAVSALVIAGGSLHVLESVITIPFPVCRADGPHLPARADRGATVGDLILGNENRLVVIAAASVAKYWGKRYNPLVLYGASGTGKSHFATGLVALFRAEFPSAQVSQFTAIDFARRVGTPMEGEESDYGITARAADLFVIEDLQYLVDWPHAQQELTRVLDELVARERQAIVTMRHAPQAVDGLAPGLRSRLAAGLAIRLNLPGTAARFQMIRDYVARRRLTISEADALDLAGSVQGTFGDLRARLLTWEMEKDHNVAAVRTTAFDSCENDSHALDRIARLSAGYFGMRVRDLRGPSRRRQVALARSIAMYLARQHTSLSFKRIAAHFGRNDHTTAIYACEKIKQQLADDPYIRHCVESLRGALCETDDDGG